MEKFVEVVAVTSVVTLFLILSLERNAFVDRAVLRLDDRVSVSIGGGTFDHCRIGDVFMACPKTGVDFNEGVR